MPYTFIERRRIHRKAQKLVGIKPKQGGYDRFNFMTNCIADLTESGEAADEGDARDICEMLWSEIEGMDEEYY